jgi:hypothetical protein
MLGQRLRTSQMVVIGDRQLGNCLKEDPIDQPCSDISVLPENTNIGFYQYCTMSPEYCALVTLALSARNMLENFMAPTTVATLRIRSRIWENRHSWLPTWASTYSCTHCSYMNACSRLTKPPNSDIHWIWRYRYLGQVTASDNLRKNAGQTWRCAERTHHPVRVQSTCSREQCVLSGPNEAGLAITRLGTHCCKERARHQGWRRIQVVKKEISLVDCLKRELGFFARNHVSLLTFMSS